MSERMRVDLNGKVVIVTGAGGVIGRAMAKEFANNGATVIAADIVTKTLEETRDEIRQAGKDCIIKTVDLCKKEEVKQMMDEVAAECGGIDVLCNNAGINGGPEFRQNYWEYNDGLYEKILSLDLEGAVYYSSKYAIPYMLGRGGGSIINTASIVGVVPLRLQCAFAAAKGAVVNMTKAMAVELGKEKIRVNALCPGSVRTAMVDALFYNNPAAGEALLSHVSLHRTGDPAEMASMVNYLASDDAAYITGQIIAVDGGWIAGYNR